MMEVATGHPSLADNDRLWARAAAFSASGCLIA
jgi:hypothetical protein